MIPKEDFVNAVNSIKEVEDFYHQHGYKCYAKNAITRTLMDAIGDKYEWVAWYINTTKYGKVNNSVSTGDSTESVKHYVIDSPDALYDFLVDYYAEHETGRIYL
jgi:hypothetical protein